MTQEETKREDRLREKIEQEKKITRAGQREKREDRREERGERRDETVPKLRANILVKFMSETRSIPNALQLHG